MFYLFGIFPVIGIMFTWMLTTYPDWRKIAEERAEKARLKAEQAKLNSVRNSNSASKKNPALSERLTGTDKQQVRKN